MPPDESHLGRTLAKAFGVAMLSLAAKHFLGDVTAAIVGTLGLGLVAYGYLPQWFKVGFWNTDRIAIGMLASALVLTSMAVVAAEWYVPGLHLRQPEGPNAAIVEQIRKLAVPPVAKPVTIMARGYEYLPYTSGKPLAIRMQVQNTGDESVTLFGGTHSVVIDELPSDPDKRMQLEQSLWDMSERYAVIPNRPLVFHPYTMTADLTSEQLLSEELINKLSAHSVMYLMTILRSRGKKTVLESCVHTDPLQKVIFLCVGHNKP